MTSFSDLISEAFIDPLRSVLIVDDEYPTWEEILNSYKPKEDVNTELSDRSSRKPWRDNANSLLQIINKFRENKPGLIIDIHDPFFGSMETGSELADHLHQSDLLILDYNLEGTVPRGLKAREILKSVLTNQHFNLIAIHTGEDDLSEVMSECLMSLLAPCQTHFSDQEKVAIKEIDEDLIGIDEDKFSPSLVLENFSVIDYLHVRKIGFVSATREFMSGKWPLSGLSALGREAGLKGGDLKKFFLWAINNFENTRKDDFCSEELSDLSWSFENDAKWLRSSKGFVTFLKKGPEDLLGQLKLALECWKPTPSRLLSAKYRHELNRIGVDAEDAALSKRHVFSYFYDVLCKEYRENESREIGNAKLREHVSRQSEALSFLVEDGVVDYGKKILSVDAEQGYTFQESYGVDLSKEMLKARSHYNSYVSTLPTKESCSGQLDTGHIFRIDDNWWVCATPICDMQPDRTLVGYKGQSDSVIPFTALKLICWKMGDITREHINSGAYCFVEHDGDVIALGVRDAKGEAAPSGVKVTWRNFLALNKGKIENNELSVQELVLSDVGIQPMNKTALIVAKLRYAYALNYIQKVGASVSRIGLEYETHK
ncbi:response regulator receiver domain [Gilvimarinus polysaccharolyticus]|uniref:response regulator receiver domain n=1 Tax=Gilvimarinus polysaccharolyticus TaxID=863921 RepID=UPI000673B0C3|nr:response regulator receiver domain [Gilvimarinus polysaccharolyticus]